MTARRRSARAPSRRPRAGTLLLAVLGVLLIWQIVTKTFAAFLSGVEPRWTLVLAPGNAEATLRLADRMLGQDPARGTDDPDRLPPLDSAASRALVAQAAAKGIPLPMVTPDIAPGDRARLRRMIAARWLDAPLDARAPRLLGQLAASDDSARDVMRRSRALSMRETLAVYWLTQDAFLRGDQAAMLADADILLRTHPDLAPYVVPLMVRAAAGQNGVRSLKAVLESGPSWRPLFFESICSGLFNLSLPMDLFLDLRDKASPPTRDEVKPYLACLIGHELYSVAHDVWLRLLHGGDTHGGGLLFDGRFEVQSSGMPFDWMLRTNGGVRADVSDAPGKPGRNAVTLEFLEAFINLLSIQQTVVLEPGDYAFAGRETGLFTAKHGLRWTLACVARPFVPFAQSDRLFGAAAGWTDFSFAFTVPPRDCPAQIVRLDIDAVSDSERIVSGKAWFTDLAVTPRPSTPRP